MTMYRISKTEESRVIGDEMHRLAETIRSRIAFHRGTDDDGIISALQVEERRFAKIAEHYWKQASR